MSCVDRPQTTKARQVGGPGVMLEGVPWYETNSHSSFKGACLFRVIFAPVAQESAEIWPRCSSGSGIILSIGAARDYGFEDAASAFSLGLLVPASLGITISSVSPSSFVAALDGSTSTGNSSTRKIRCVLFSV